MRRRLGAAAILAFQFAALAWAGTGPTMAQPCRAAECVQRFPPGAGSLNVRDFGAKGDGRSDDTAALTAALAASGGDTGRQMWHDQIVFLPAGTYLVSDTLVKRYANGAFASGAVLVGESVEATIIRLADHSPGFTDPAAPRAVVMTTSKRIDRAGNRDYEGKGEGNDAYENFVENLTVDVGSGNPGAIGIDYLGNNLGAVRDVLVRARPGSGSTGIAMLRKWPGPALLQRVAIEGFDVGIDIANTEYGVTLSRISLTGQRRVALRNSGNMVSAEALDVHIDQGTALVNRLAGGMVVLTHSTLATKGMALDNEGILVFRGTSVEGGAIVPAMGAGRALEGWLAGMDQWHASTGHTPAPAYAPMVAPDRIDRWAAPPAPPADNDSRQDMTASLQTAFNSGASTIYLPHGTYWLSDSIAVPASVHRILGMNATLRVLPKRDPAFARTTGILRIATPGTPLLIERLAMDNTNAGSQVGIELAARRTLVVKDVVGAGLFTVTRRAEGGPAFLEDTCCGPTVFEGSAPVVARQLNSEGSGVRVTNHGAPLTVIGLKTEGFCTAILTDEGGQTDLLGGLVYVVVRNPAGDVPAFITRGGRLRASFVEESLVPTSHYRVYLSEQSGPVPVERLGSDMPPRGLGRLAPNLDSAHSQ